MHFLITDKKYVCPVTVSILNWVQPSQPAASKVLCFIFPCLISPFSPPPTLFYSCVSHVYIGFPPPFSLTLPSPSLPAVCKCVCVCLAERGVSVFVCCRGMGRVGVWVWGKEGNDKIEEFSQKSPIFGSNIHIIHRVYTLIH